MPLLSKKAFAKPMKKVAKTFKQPLLTQENINKIIGKGVEERKQHSSNVSATTSTSEKKAKKLERKLSQKSFSMHVSFEEAQSENNSDLSYRMNEPAVKDAYLKFVKSFSQSNKADSICSTPRKKADSILSKSLDDIFKSVDRSSPVKEEESTANEEQPEISPDSGFSLSQEILNQKEVKDAYLECMDQFMGQEQFDFMKNFKPTNKRPKSMNKSFDKCSKKKSKKSKEEIKTPKGTEDKPGSTGKKPIKREGNKKRKAMKDAGVVESNEGISEKKSKTNSVKKGDERISLYEKMVLIQESRNVGLYALCDICDKARYLPHIKDPLDLPDKWYCSMNPDKQHNNCSDPEEVDENEVEYLIDNLYNAGSIVWAKMDGYPWWPAMVEDDPDNETYFWLEKDVVQPTWYHLTFFDSYEVTRAWLRPSCIKPFKINMTNPEMRTSKFDKYKPRVEASIKQAVDAINLPLIDRLRKYSFIQRYPKPLKQVVGGAKTKQGQTKRVSKKNDGVSRKKSKIVRKIVSSTGSLVKSDDDISDILNSIDWQNGTNINLNLLD